MRKCFAFLVAWIVLMSCVIHAAAAESHVIYTGGAENFIFAPGSDHAPTDLFYAFKDVMPGDNIQQTITVKNDASNKYKIEVYMRALGGHKDSVDFLSQLSLTVTKGSDAVMFGAPADQPAQLSDWVYLGTLRPGGECDLIVTLHVPVTLDSQYMNMVGYLDWEFAVVEFLDESTVPESPSTGDNSRIYLWAGLMIGSFVLLLILLLDRKKKKDV